MNIKPSVRVVFLAVYLALGATLFGQTNGSMPELPLAPANGYSEVGEGILKIGRGIYDSIPTNNTVAIYGTYVLRPHKYGVGILDAYNISKGIGVVGGVDYLGGQFVGINGGIQIKKTFNWHGLSVTPFAISALLTPLQGGGSENGGLGTANSAGMDIKLYKQFDVGGLCGTRTGSGSYSGGYINAYASLHF